MPEEAADTYSLLQVQSDLASLRQQVDLLLEVMDQTFDWGTAVPATPAAGTRRFSADGGYDSYISGVDGNQYMCGLQTQWLTALQSTTSTSAVNVPGMSIAVASGITYRVHAVMRLSQGGAGTQAMGGGLAGPSVSMGMLWGYSINEGGGGSTPSTGESATFPVAFATTSGAGVKEVVMDGIFTPSANGTLTMQYLSETAGTTNANIGTFMDVRPV